MSTQESPATGQVRCAGISVEEIRAHVQRILASPQFTRSGRLCRFLTFCVDQALDGAGDQLKEHLKEQSIGAAVFDRAIAYDPRIDPIVRVEARRLRAKLQAYYAAAGSAELFIIEFPKGTYAPIFKVRELRAPAPVDQPGETSIAVLPFLSLTPGGGDDYFSDGLTEELIHLLTRVRGLRIVSWNSASQLRGREQDLDAIRRQLLVGVVLRGSVRRTPDRVRVTVQMIDTGSGAYLWSEAYDRGMQDLFAIQEEIARAIVDTLQLALASPRGARAIQPGLSSGPSSGPNLECYNLCLQARFHANRRTTEGLEKSVACFEQAIAADSTSALAHAGLADSYSLLVDYGTAPPSELIPKARAAAEHALALDPHSAEANVALAFIRSMFDWDWPEGETLYRRAISANPGYARARHWYGIDYLALLGRFPEALSEIQIAHRLDPLSQIIFEGLGALYMLSRDYDNALAAFRGLMDLDPTFYKAYGSMGRTFSLMGRFDEAIATFQKGRSLAGDVPSLIGALGQTLALAGRSGEARDCLGLLHQISRTRYIPSVTVGILHMGLDETSHALDAFERACDRREVAATWLNIHPVYDPIRAEPRFQALLRRMNF